MHNKDNIVILYNELQCIYKSALKIADKCLYESGVMLAEFRDSGFRRYSLHKNAMVLAEMADYYYEIAMRLSKNADDLKFYVY